MRFKRTLLFRFERQESCDAAMHPAMLAQLQELAGEVSVQLYQRMPRSRALPAALVKLRR